MGVMNDALRALENEREEYKSRRAAIMERITGELPQAAELLSEIRGIFLRAVEDVLSRADENAFEKARDKSLKKQEELRTLLSGNGHEPDALFERPMCTACADSGFIGGKPCACLRRHLAAARTTGLSALDGMSFDNFDLDMFSRETDPHWGLSQRENMEGNLVYCRSWIKNFCGGSPNLFLNGGTGQGKTFLCGCVARAAAEKGVEVRYVTAIEMFTDLENKRFERAEADVRPYYECELLIIDDLGTEMTTAFIQSALYDIINTRLSAARKMIINANFTAREITQVYMPQICSRLLGEFKQLHFFGPDIRMR